MTFDKVTLELFEKSLTKVKIDKELEIRGHKGDDVRDDQVVAEIVELGEEQDV